MSKNLVVSLLCVVFVVLAIVSKLEGGIENIAYAQIWDFSANIQSQNVNNLHVNSSSVLQHNSNNKISITSNCIAPISHIHNNGVSSGVDDNVSVSSLSSSS